MIIYIYDYTSCLCIITEYMTNCQKWIKMYQWIDWAWKYRASLQLTQTSQKINSTVCRPAVHRNRTQEVQVATSQVETVSQLTFAMIVMGRFAVQSFYITDVHWRFWLLRWDPFLFGVGCDASGLLRLSEANRKRVRTTQVKCVLGRFGVHDPKRERSKDLKDIWR